MEHLLAHSPEEEVWKYVLPVEDVVDVMTRKGARFLPHIEVTPTGVEVWALVRPDNEPVRRRLHLRGTGHRINGAVGAGYLATGSITHGTAKFVLHVFVDPGEHEVHREEESDGTPATPPPPPAEG